MRQYILASHGLFSKGIFDSMKMIIGDKENVNIITAYIEENVDIKNQINSLINSIPEEDEIIVCTDVFGGSINNEFMSYLHKKNFHLITGINLPLLINLFLNEDKEACELIKESLEQAKDGLIYCNEKLKQIIDDEF